MILNPLPRWVTSVETQQLLKALIQEGNDQDKTRFVGGCVRDHLWGLESQDIDLATSLWPEEILQRLATKNIKTVALGLKHGSIQAHIGKKKYEITTLRRDISTNGRHADVAFTDDWTVDAQRRDFTVNALYLSSKGDLFDPCGQGLEDLKHHRIRFIGKADQRIQEDYLRLLRFFRFHAYYGQDEMDLEALKACQQYAPYLKQLSAERLHAELFKLLKALDPVYVIKKMVESNVWYPLTHLDTLPDLKRFSALIHLEPLWSLPIDPLRRLVVLAGGQEQAMRTLAQILKFSKAEIQDSQWFCQGLTLNKISSENLWYQQGWTRAQGLLLMRHLWGYSSSPLNPSYQHRPRPLFPLSGHDLIQAGISRGAFLGWLLKETERWWIDQNFMPSREECLLKAFSIKNK